MSLPDASVGWGALYLVQSSGFREALRGVPGYLDEGHAAAEP